MEWLGHRLHETIDVVTSDAEGRRRRRVSDRGLVSQCGKAAAKLALRPLERFVLGHVLGRRRFAFVLLERQRARLDGPVPTPAPLFHEHVDNMFIVHIAHGISRWQSSMLAW